MMENEFYRDEFEQMLKDTTDDFKMYPSRKIWHSIYNDLHPDRKWPSLAVCLLLLTGILYLGVTNNNAINTSGKNIAALTIEKPVEVSKTEKSVPGNNNSSAVLSSNTKNGKAVFSEEPTVTVEDNETVENAKSSIASTSKLATAFTGNTLAQNKDDKFISSTPQDYAMNIAAEQKTIPTETGLNFEVSSTPMLIEANADKVIEQMPDGGQAFVGPAKASLIAIEEASLKTPGLQNLEWNTAYAGRNKSIRLNNFLKGLSTQFYVTPSIGYRVMFKNNDYADVATNALIAANN